MPTAPQIVDSGGMFGGRLLVFESLPSTNRWALDNIAACHDGDVIRANRQTAGRGRFERAWLCPEDRGLAVSVVLKSPAEVVAAHATQAAAIALHALLDTYGLVALLKWPNDVLVHGRKIAGILAERQPETGAVVLGIGLNVNLTENDLAGGPLLYPATSMRIEKARSFDVSCVCRDLIRALEASLRLLREEGAGALFAAWRACDYLTGRRICVSTSDGPVSGVYDGIEADGRLRLCDNSGAVRLFWSGDVSIEGRTVWR